MHPWCWVPDDSGAFSHPLPTQRIRSLHLWPRHEAQLPFYCVFLRSGHKDMVVAASSPQTRWFHPRWMGEHPLLRWGHCLVNEQPLRRLNDSDCCTTQNILLNRLHQVSIVLNGSEQDSNNADMPFVEKLCLAEIYRRAQIAVNKTHFCWCKGNWFSRRLEGSK